MEYYNGMKIIILPEKPDKQLFVCLRKNYTGGFRDRAKYIPISDYKLYSNLADSIYDYHPDDFKQCNIIYYNDRYDLFLKWVKFVYLSEDDLIIKEIIE